MGTFTPEQRAKAADTRRANAAAKREAAARAQGVGESKQFGGDYRPPDVIEREERILNCHLDGRLIRGMNLPAEVLAALSYRHTDEGVEEMNKGRSNHRIEVGRGPEDKAVDQYRDDRKERRMPKGQARNPMRALLDRHVQPGERPKFLSSSRTGTDDLDGYTPVLNEQGKPVKYKTMTLGVIPEAEAQARESADRAKDRNRIKQTEQQTEERRIRMQRGDQLPPITPDVESR